jgi:hypothetical protein
MMASLEEMIEKLGPRLAPQWEAPQPGDENYRRLLESGTGSLPSYPWRSPDQREEALRVVEQLVNLSRSWSATEETLADGAPRPMPELRARPRI